MFLTKPRLAMSALFALFVWGLLLPVCALAGPMQPCPRFRAGSTVTAPPDLFSAGGVLTVDFTYLTRVDQFGNTLFCFTTDDGAQDPTLHVRPGDLLVINFKNGLSASLAAPRRGHAMPEMIVSGSASDTCGALVMTPASVNIHYHGTNTSPTCRSEERRVGKECRSRWSPYH